MHGVGPLLSQLADLTAPKGAQECQHLLVASLALKEVASSHSSFETIWDFGMVFEVSITAPFNCLRTDAGSSRQHSSPTIQHHLRDGLCLSCVRSISASEMSLWSHWATWTLQRAHLMTTTHCMFPEGNALGTKLMSTVCQDFVWPLVRTWSLISR